MKDIYIFFTFVTDDRAMRSPYAVQRKLYKLKKAVSWLIRKSKTGTRAVPPPGSVKVTQQAQNQCINCITLDHGSSVSVCVFKWATSVYLS